MLDLRDSVQPEANKTIARKTIVEWVSSRRLKNNNIFSLDGINL